MVPERVRWECIDVPEKNSQYCFHAYDTHIDIVSSHNFSHSTSLV